MSKNYELRFAIFSFNRGKFLDHCVSSIANCTDSAKITVYDDNSDDPDTLRVLESLSISHTIVQPKPSTVSKHGGLSANMQLAMDQCTEDVNLCFMQDDMQMVRSIDETDLRHIENCFVDSSTAFVHPVFLKGWNREKDLQRTQYQPASHSYTRLPNKAGAGIFYADVMITKPQRLRQMNWSFSTREKANELLARQQFSQMHFLYSPFLMWLPSVPTYREKRNTLALRIGEKRHQCGFHPISTMNENKVQLLKDRESSVLPVAEDWLALEHKTLPIPWVYEPMHGSRSLKWLNRLELSLRS